MLQARKLGKELLVGVHSDEEILENKGPTVMTLNERSVHSLHMAQAGFITDRGGEVWRLWMHVAGFRLRFLAPPMSHLYPGSPTTVVTMSFTETISHLTAMAAIAIDLSRKRAVFS